MTEDVGTTPRKPLTPTQRLALYESFHGMCVLCGLRIVEGEPWIEEHLRALGLGGTNKWDNRAPVHIRCAEVKTVGDMERITDAKRQKRKALRIKPAGAQKLQSRGFEQYERPSKIGMVRIEKQAPPRQGGIRVKEDDR